MRAARSSHPPEPQRRTFLRVKVDAFATEPQYLAHLAPIWHALDPDERGAMYVTGPAIDRAVEEGIPPRVGYPRPANRPTMVASYQDEQEAARMGRPIIYVEHGAGQTYRGGEKEEHPSYSGSAGHSKVIAFICPSETVAARWRERYPTTPAAAVGCPKLDGWLSRARDNCHPEPLVVVSFHSDVRWCPESTSSWKHYQPTLGRMIAETRARGFRIAGHGHPRIQGRVADAFERHGCRFYEDFGEVLTEADVYACDNSSTLPEAAAVGIPLVWMNAPWYRRDVDHGGRFWEWPRGQATTDGPEGFPSAAAAAFEDPPAVRAAREHMVAGVYATRDGSASRRAAEAIRAVVSVAS